MMCANQRMIATVLPFLTEEPPVLLDWPPWNHTFGGNHNLNMVLRNGGSLYIDEGRPAPGLIEKTVRPAEVVGKQKQADAREAAAKQAAKEAAEAKAAEAAAAAEAKAAAEAAAAEAASADEATTEAAATAEA
jgi:feruloyl-CoA synthase